jgi:hypothetical protein
VRSIAIHRSDGVTVIASIYHGWYLAWWPSNAHATYATITARSGVHMVALPALARVTTSCKAITRSRLSNGRSLSGACASSETGSNGPGSDGVLGPPLVGDALAKPFQRTLLLKVDNASRVLVCFHPPADVIAALRPDGPTGPCAHAARLTRLPPGYPVQKNLLEVFPNSVWKVELPTGRRYRTPLTILVVAVGTSRFPQARNEITVAW